MFDAATPAIDSEALAAVLDADDGGLPRAVERLPELTIRDPNRAVAAIHHLSEQVGYRGVVEVAATLGGSVAVMLGSFPSFDDAVLGQAGTQNGDLAPVGQALQAQHDHEAVRLLRDFARELRRAASRFERPTRALERPVQAFVSAWGPQLRVELLRTASGDAWAIQTDTLLEKAAVEMFELATTRPRLRNCTRCGRVFVPRRRESHCVGHLWTWPDARFVAFCRRDLEAAAATSRRTDHDRLRDQTYQQIRRMKKVRAGLTGEAAKSLDKKIARLQAERAQYLRPRGPIKRERAPAVPAQQRGQDDA